jgi:hypothetical protein
MTSAPLQVVEEGGECSQIVRIERRGAQRTELGCRLLQPVGIAAGQDHVGTLGACAPCGLQPDAGAAADHDDGLPEQLRLARGGSPSRCSGHCLSVPG